MCDLKNHDLQVIYTADVGWNEEHTVRWCADCGAVVVDTDSDNRVFAGRIMKMQFPEYLREFIEMKKRIKNGSNN